MMWSVVGLMLCRLALSWYNSLGFGQHLIWFLIAIPTALAIYLFGFSTLAKLNIQRIQKLPPKACVFAFMQWWNYPLVLSMISLGIWMRHSPIPKQYLGILYFGIGLSLFLASLHYYWTLISGRPVYSGFSPQESINPTPDSTHSRNADLGVLEKR
jgi:hypothetical protein